MTTTKAKLEFVHAMARHTKATVRQCEALMRYAATLERLAVQEINTGPWLLSHKLKKEHIRQCVHNLCAEISRPVDGSGELPMVTATCSNVPGAVLKIRVPSGYTNDFGGEGICVPS